MNDSQAAYHHTPPTPLQVWTQAAFDLLADAREVLDDRSYTWFIGIVTDRVGAEAARLAVAEAMAATRQSAEGEAA